MAKEFVSSDELLLAHGILVVYYLIFRSAIIHGEMAKLNRRKLFDFRKILAESREAAINNYEDASFDYLEFDRLNQQGTNDASSIKERVRILSEFLGVDMTPNVHPVAIRASALLLRMCAVEARGCVA